MSNRARLLKSLTDNQGNLLAGSIVRVLQPGTTTPIADTIYADDTSVTTLANPFTTGDGQVGFYLSTPQRVRLGVTAPGQSEVFFEDLDVFRQETIPGPVAYYDYSDSVIPAEFTLNSRGPDGTPTSHLDVPPASVQAVGDSPSGTFTNSVYMPLIDANTAVVGTSSDAVWATAFSFDVTLIRPAVVGFYVKVHITGSVGDGAFAAFQIDATDITSVGGTTYDFRNVYGSNLQDAAWHYVEFEVPEGAHTLSWVQIPSGASEIESWVGPILVNYDLSSLIDSKVGKGDDPLLAGSGLTNTGTGVVLGPNNTNGGTSATVVGEGATNLDGSNAVAIGNGPYIDTGANDSVAIGTNSYVSASDAVAVGANASVTGANATAVGENATASGTTSTAVGPAAVSASTYSVAVGNANVGTTADESVAIGKQATVSNAANDAVAVGASAIAHEPYAVAVGFSADGYDSGVAVGKNSTAQDSGVAVGDSANASVAGAVAIGSGAAASAAGAMTIGGTAPGANGVSHGLGSYAGGADTVAVGHLSDAESDYSVAIGSSAQVFPSSDGGIAIGESTLVNTAVDGVAIGHSATTTGDNGTALGRGTSVTHDNSTAVGQGATTTATHQVMVGTASETVVIPGSIAWKVEAINSVASSGAAQTLPAGDTAAMHRIVLDANCTLTFPTAAAGASFSLFLVQDATGSRTVTWPVTVQWANGTAPTLTPTPSKTDALSFICADGTNWLGFVAGQSF